VNALDKAIRDAFALFEPPLRLGSADWAEQNITLGRSVSSRTGRLRLYPWQRAALDFADTVDVSSVILMWPSQALGKSLVLQSLLSHRIAQRPAPSLVLQPSLDMAQAFAKTKLFPVFNTTPALRGLIAHEAGEQLQGQGANSVSLTRFPGGFCVLGSAGSEASLRSYSCSLLLFDEVSLYDPSAGSGGDPIALALRRAEAFPDALTVYASTPAINPGCRISMEYEDSSKHRWTVTCPQCSLPWVFRWEHVRWNRSVGKDGKTVHETLGAWLQCPHCESKYNDKQRVQLALAGSFVAERPEITHRIGLHASALITPLPARKGYGGSKIAEFADEFLKAEKRGSYHTRTFVNTVLAEPFEIETETDLPVDGLVNRREMYPEFEDTGEVILHDRCGLITAAVDVQRDRLELLIVGWGPHNESWGLLYSQIRGDTSKPEVWANAKQLLTKQYRHPTGRMLSPYLVFVDAAYKPDMAYRFVRQQMPNAMAIRGASGYAPVGQANVTRSVGDNNRLLLIKIDGVKTTIRDLLQITEPGAGCQHFPENIQCGFDEYFFNTLVNSEKLKQNGNSAPTWVKKTSETRNEGLDLYVYAFAACEFANPNWDAVARNMAVEVVNPWNDPKGGTVKDYQLKQEIICSAPTTPIQTTLPKRVRL
jgi:phage terminase large subunit GpA-like protein